MLAELMARSHDVVGLARSHDSASTVRSHGAQVAWGDLDDPESIDAALAEAPFDCLVCVASLGFGHAPAIVAAAENAGVRRAVFVSTTAVETSLPAESKAVRLAAEKTIHDSALDWTIVRPTMIYGAPGDRNMSRLVRLVERAPLLPLPGDGSGLQQPVHVVDLARTIVTAAERDIAIGRTYSVAGPEPLSFRQILDATFAAVSRPPRYARVPTGPVRATLGMAEWLLPTPPIKVEQLDRLQEDKVFDIDPARRDLDHDPRPFDVGIKELVDAL